MMNPEINNCTAFEKICIKLEEERLKLQREKGKQEWKRPKNEADVTSRNWDLEELRIALEDKWKELEQEERSEPII